MLPRDIVSRGHYGYRGAEAEAAFRQEFAWQDAGRRGEHLPDGPAVECRSYVGGQPVVWQPWTTNPGASWRFFFQLDDAEGWDGDLYALNFGGGTGYAFLSEDEREGRFMRDCV